MKKYLITACIFFIINTSASGQEIRRIWLTFKKNTPSHIVINWQSNESGNSEVHLKVGETEVFSTIQAEDVYIHHIEVPINQIDVMYNYMVKTNNQTSSWHMFHGIPTKKPLKVAVFANWGFAGTSDITGILNEEPTIIATSGDNIPDLYGYGEQGDIHCAESYLKMVDAHPELFNHIPFMPVLGNHDKQLYPRGIAPPDDFMVYDTLSTAFTEFFELPGDEWKWSFEIPYYDIQLLAVDLDHIGDIGGNWQSCRVYHSDSDQYKWYVNKVSSSKYAYKITLNNSNNPHLRNVEHGIWKDAMENNNAVISGSGYYAEVARPNETLYINTSLIAGDVYPDAQAILTVREASYVLLTCHTDSLTINLRNLNTNKDIYTKTFTKYLVENTNEFLYTFDNQIQDDSIILDESGDGNAYNLKFMSEADRMAAGGAPQYAVGMQANTKAMMFDGKTNWVEVQELYTPGILGGAEATTVSAWIKPEYTTAPAMKPASQCIIALGYANGPELAIRNDTLWASYMIRDNDNPYPNWGPLVSVILRAPFNAANVWSLVQLTAQGDAVKDSTYVTLYINGAAVATAALLGCHIYGTTTGWGSIGASGAWGALNNAGILPGTGSGDTKIANLFKGLIDEVKIERKSITAEEALAKYLAEKPVENPIADAGADQSEELGTMITLNGSNSSDPGGLDITYAWTIGEVLICSEVSLSTDTLSIGDHNIVLTVTNTDGKTDSDTVLITIAKGTYFKSNLSTAINVYPNPTAGNLYLDLSGLQEEARIEVLNMLGTIVIEKIVKTANVRELLNLNDLNTGLYFIRIKSGNETVNRKIQVTRIIEQ